MNINNVPVAKKLWTITLLLVLMLSLVALASQRMAGKALRQAVDQVELHDGHIQSALRWRGLLDTAVQASISKALTSEPVVSEMLSHRIAQIIATSTEIHARIAAIADTPREKAALEAIADIRKRTAGVVKHVEEVRQAGDRDALVLLVEQEIKPAAARYIGALDEFVSLQEALRQEARDQALLHADSVEQAGWFAMAAVTSLGLIVLGWLSRSITRPLGEAVRVARVIAGGGLTPLELDIDRRDEIGQLMRAMAQMSQRLHQMMCEVRHGVESVSTASTQIASGNQDLSARTEQMAANLQQTASSMEEITATVSQSAETAHQASNRASAALQSARRGGEAAAQVVETMERINQDSRRIADIIGVIDGIAFQTNILALNAAVEAARAGEQGRGFAVVAGEVRSLAQRSAEAAKEIKELIHASVQTIAAGHALVAQTGGTMRDIISDVQRVSDLMGEIAKAASEQRNGISQVNSAVSSLEQVTQQNAAQVEESASAAQSLRQQAQRLAQAMDVFTLERSAGA